MNEDKTRIILDGSYIRDCPFCNGDEFGCCMCDHSGIIDIRYYPHMDLNEIKQEEK